MNPTRIFLAGATAALAIALGYVAIVGLYATMGAPPHDTHARLTYFAANDLKWQGILWLSVFTDLLFLVVAAALYFALPHGKKWALAIAGICVALFVILDLAVTWTNYAALITLGGRYAKATNEIQKAAAVAAADYAAAVTDSGLLFFYNTLTLSVSIMITGMIMAGGRFSKLAARLGVATGVVGIVAVVGPAFVPALSGTIIAASVLTTGWLLSVGHDLLVLARQPPHSEPHTASQS
jgi:hypothetical protein